MAYDTTALITAIAQRKISEVDGKQLISEFDDLQIKVAKLLEQQVEEQPVVEPQPEPVQEVSIEQAQLAGEVPDGQA